MENHARRIKKELVADDPVIEEVSEDGSINGMENEEVSERESIDDAVIEEASEDGSFKVEPFEDDCEEVSSSVKEEEEEAPPDEDIYVEDGLNMDLYSTEGSVQSKRVSDPGERERLEEYEDLDEVKSSPETDPESGMENPCSVTEYCSVKMEVHSTDGEDVVEDPVNEYGGRGRTRVDSSPSSCNEDGTLDGSCNPRSLGSGGLLRPAFDGESNTEDGFGWSNNVGLDGESDEEERVSDGVCGVDYGCLKQEKRDSIGGLNSTVGNDGFYFKPERRVGIGRRKFKSDEDVKNCNKKQLFSCEKCDYTTDRKWSLNRHSIIHDSRRLKPFKCSVCDYRSNDKGNLTRHLLIHMGSFDSEGLLGSMGEGEGSLLIKRDMELLRNTEGSNRCKVEFPGSLGSFNCGERSEDNEECEVSSKQRICSQCGRWSDVKQSVKVEDEEQDDESEFRCAFCSYETTLKRNLKKPKVDNEDKVFQCPSCSYKSNTKEYLTKHSIVHKEAKSFKCSFPSCTYATNRRDSLTRHTLVHNEAKLYKCQWFSCPYETNIKSDLKTHSLKHIIGGAKLFKCDDCSYETNKRSNLSSHRANRHVVDKKKSFRCSYCPFNTDDKSCLTNHVMTEHRDKIFKCSTCPYETYHRHVFEVHLLRHSSTKLYKCVQCQYETNYKSALKRHMKVHS